MSDDKKQGDYAKSVVSFLDKYGEKLFSGVASVYKHAADETRLNWRSGYGIYLNNALSKYSYAKSFLSTDDPIPLYETYVPLTIYGGGKESKKATMEDLIVENRFSIITASGGSGKTMMMRHLFINTIETTDLVPVFVELRDLNKSDLSLMQLIKKKLRDNKFNFTDEYIDKAFEAGHFALLLDGFDEVADFKRENIIKEIEEITNKYVNNILILSSRPDESLHKWQLFTVWKIQPLTEDLACELVEKVEADEKIKEKFINALRDELFEKHESFLSNPLLLCIMLITYKDSAHIPNKISTFYDRAYTALFEKHDARKAFHRDKRSKLDILEFRKIFSTFCFITFNRNIFNFSETLVYENLEKARKISGISFDMRDFLHDSIQAVCLLLRDGLEITFSHRSFQEYFTALFIAQMDSVETQQKILFNLLEINEFFFETKEVIFDLLFEISPDTIEKALIIPYLSTIAEKIGYVNFFGDNEYKELLYLLYTNFSISEIYDESIDDFIDEWGVAAGIKNNEIHNFISLVQKYYLKQLTSELEKDTFLFEFLERNFSYSEPVPISRILLDSEIYPILAEGNGWFSKRRFKAILDLRKTLFDKHRRKQALLDEELV